jgi:hypothetical protein
MLTNRRLKGWAKKSMSVAFGQKIAPLQSYWRGKAKTRRLCEKLTNKRAFWKGCASPLASRVNRR